MSAEIGISYPTPEIIPLCFAVITSLGHSYNIGENPLQNIILNHFSNLFHIFESIDPNDANKDGKPFEQLTITALHVRLLLWAETQFGGDNPEQTVKILFRSFLPSSESFFGCHPQLQSSFFVHLI